MKPPSSPRWSALPQAPATLVALVLIVICYLPIVLRMERSCSSATSSPPGSSTVCGRSTGTAAKDPPPFLAVPSSLEDAVNSATGTLFEGNRIRTFEEERYFPHVTGRPDPRQKQPNRLRQDGTAATSKTSTNAAVCEGWNVVTTIFAPSEAVIRAARVPGWCTVIVADTKTPPDYMGRAGLVGMEETVHYLSVEDQKRWLDREEGTAVGRFLAAIPYRHFARKNIGYLYAIQQGANLLFDFDDDNLLPLDPKTGLVSPPLPSPDADGRILLRDARMVVTGPDVFNHHPLMGATVTNSWARGFPLQYIQDNSTQGQVAYGDATLDVMDRVGVMQFCANDNPDIDAIHRLVHPLPMTFSPPPGGSGKADTGPISGRGALVVPSHAFAPYNAQATVHTRGAFWALLLPFTVPGRVSDIWRGYFAEALFRDLGLAVAFLPPAIVQDRNEHHYLADMQAELDLYFKGGKLVEFLAGWDNSPAQTVPERMEGLWIDLYERGYIDINDVRVAQLWLAALVEIGYQFPTMARRRLDHTVLMGQFNFAIETPNVLFWHQKWRQWFNRIVVRGPFNRDQIKELQRHGIRAYWGREDRGHNSPIANLAATLQEAKAEEGVTGVLYAHDDMLLNVTNVFRDFPFGTNRLLGTMHKNPTDPRFYSFSIHPNGTYTTKDGASDVGNRTLLTMSAPWTHSERCLDGFLRLFADPRSKPLLEGDGSLRVPIGMQSDVLYVPTALADAFAGAARLIVDHGVFLECGLPKIYETLARTSNVTMDRAALCTSWEYQKVRGRVEMMEQCRLPAAAVHPVKLHLGHPVWDQAFEWATMGKSKFRV
jgi:hypothetical protein